MNRRAGPMVAPPVLWLAHFVAVYALASLACAGAPGLAPTLIPVGTAIVTGAALLVAFAGAWRRGRALRGGGLDDQQAFVARTGLLLYALAALAMGWVALPGLLLTGCA